jgi:MFS family permease
VSGLCTSTGVVTFNSVVQSAVPEAMRGRVYTLEDMTWQAMRLLSVLLGGLLIDSWGVIQPIYWVGGFLLLLAGALGLFLFRQAERWDPWCRICRRPTRAYPGWAGWRAV